MKSLNLFLKETYWDGFRANKYKDPSKSILYDYVSGLISGINDDLRANRYKGNEEVLTSMDSTFVKKSKIDVYRTVDWDYMKNIYGVTKDNINKFVGKFFINKGYMSTSKLKKSPWGSFWVIGELLIHIVSKHPVKCIDINSVFNKQEIDCYEQQEILLPRDTKLKLVDYNIEDDLYVLEMEIV